MAKARSIGKAASLTHALSKKATAGSGIAPSCYPSGSAKIIGTKFEDKDTDGTKDSGEPGLSGFRFHLTGGPTGHAVDEWATSDSSGAFTFSGVYDGGYTLTEVPTDSQIADGWRAKGPVARTVAVKDGDDVTVKFGNYRPAVTINKTVDKSTIVKGESVVYTYVVKNVGDVKLSGIVLTDDKVSGLGPAFALDAGASKTIHSTAQTLADTTRNTATVTALDPCGASVGPVSGSADVTVLKPAVTIVKTATPTLVLQGTLVTYTYAVTNSGTTTLYDLKVTDDKNPSWTATIASLAPGATELRTATLAITDDTTNVGTVVGSFYAYSGDQLGGFSGQHEDGLGCLGTVRACDDAFVDVVHPAVSLTKNVDKPTIVKGESVTYTYIVSNNGDTSLDYSLTDDQAGPAWTKTGSLAPHASATHTFIAAPVSDVTNRAVVAAHDAGGHDVSASASANVHVLVPSVSIAKSASPGVVVSGEFAHYTYTVSNTSGVPLYNLVVTDDILGSVGMIPVLAPHTTAQSLTKDAVVTADVTNVGSVSADFYGFGVTPPAEGSAGRLGAVGDSGTASVRCVHPRLDLTKSVDQSVVTSGTTVAYTYVVANTGDVPLSGVSLVDDKLGTIASGRSLGVGASLTFTSSTALTTSTVNVGKAVGTDEWGHPVSAADSCSVRVVRPAVSLIKSAAPTVALAGTPILYTYTITNTGDVPLTGLALDDAPLGHVGDVAMLAAGDSTTITTTTPIAVDTVNIGTVTGHDAFGHTVTASATASVDVVRPSISLAKSVDQAVVTSGTTVTYTYVVKNTGDTALSSIALSDNKLGAIAGMPASLAPGATATVTATALITTPVTNVGTVTAQDQWHHGVSATASASVRVVGPSVTLTKAALPTVALSGAPILYTYTITNTGDVPLSGLALNDVPLGHIGDVATLAAGDSATITTTTPILIDTVNLGTVTGHDSFGHTVTASASASVDIVSPSVSLTKSVDKPVVTDGTVVTYTYTVTNTGDVPLSAVSLGDNILGPIAGAASTLAPGATSTVTATAAITASVTNTGTVTAHDAVGHPVSATATASVRVVKPAITLSKSVDASVITSGTTVTYTYLIHNSGDVALSGVSLVDDKLGTIASGLSLAVGGSLTFTRSAPLTVSTDNTGTVTGADAWGHQVSATDTASVRVVRPAVSLTKTAAPTVALAGTPILYTYTITNTGDVPLAGLALDDAPLGHVGDVATLAAGDSATITTTTPILIDTVNLGTVTGHDSFGHTVTASASASVDIVSPSVSLTKSVDKPVVTDGTVVTYTYTVTNTGDVPLSAVSLGDNILGPITGAASTLAPGATSTVTATAAITASVTNTGTVTAHDAVGHPVSATATASVRVVHPAISVAKSSDAPALGVVAGSTVVYTYVVTNTGDVPLSSVSLVDDQLGQITVGRSLDVGASLTFTASAVLSASVTNVVTANGVDAFGHPVSANASATVDVFAPFTGQDLTITKAASRKTAGPGDLVTYTLRYRNLSGSNASDFTITDDYDSRYMVVVNSSGGDTSVDGRIQWTIPGPLAVEDGWQTITYTMRVVSSLPEGTTHVDNTAVIAIETDTDLSNNTATARVDVGENLPFLPFTGGPFSEAPIAALIAAFGAVALLVALRRSRRSA